jgi:hypothetical protein
LYWLGCFVFICFICLLWFILLVLLLFYELGNPICIYYPLRIWLYHRLGGLY